ncbi:hypothetical protein HHI36_021647 [Cryptolaemus montrouzieri]|uniref:L-lactate dehydrogenase n=1 Tax=Cryptolaemus montrouzieri TaxID=559131 RepID=A0ABD2MXP6_9CUCU
MMSIFTRNFLKKNLESWRNLTFQSKMKTKHEVSSTREKLLAEYIAPTKIDDEKITIVGLGQVGIATAFSILSQNISNHIALVDLNENKLQGEVLDLKHGCLFMGNCHVEACTDYSGTANSKICIITAGLSIGKGETRLSLVQKNTDIFKKLLPELVKYSPNTMLLIVTNPVDVMTYVSWRISGLAQCKVIGTGTNLDTSRFRFLLSQKFGVATSSCHAYIIGEHGDSSVPVWSSVDIAGVRLRDINPYAGTDKDTENWSDIHKQVINSAYQIIKLKGDTSFAIGLSTAAIAKSMLKNPINFHAVSINAKGFHGIQDDVYLSLPCLLNANGLSKIIRERLDDGERLQLQKSAEILGKVQSSVHF